MLADRVRMGSKTDDKMINIEVYATHQSKPVDSRIAFFPVIKEFVSWVELVNNPSIYLGDPVDITDATYTTPINVKTLGIDKAIWGCTTGTIFASSVHLNGVLVNNNVSPILPGMSHLGFNDFARWESPTSPFLMEGDVLGVHLGYNKA